MKAIFITGAAHGIGLTTAMHFAKQGWLVGLYDINEEALQSLLQSGNFPLACGQTCDVTSSASVESALSHFASHSGGRMDVLVNNAGLLSAGKFEEIPADQHERIIAVNVGGLTRVAHAAFPLLRKTPGATLVNLCSVSSVHGIPSLAVYSASKFYVNGLTEALNIEWAEYDIRVTSVKPPLVNTAMGHAASGERTSKLKINMQPEQVAEAIELAIEGKRTGYLLGTSGKLWGLLDRLLPENGRRALARYLTDH